MTFYSKAHTRLSGVFLLLIVILCTGKSFAQSTCSGSLGAPVFFEDFGTPASCYSSTSLSAGTTNYTFKGPGPGSNKNPPNDGEYVVWCGSTAPDWNWGLWHQTYYDHTTGTGTGTGSNMLIVNASAVSGEFYRRAISGLCPNTNYTFSIYVANMADLDMETAVCPSGSIKPELAFRIFNTGTSTLLASSNTGQIALSSDFTWNYYDFSFITGAGQTSVDVVLQNLASGGCGNDLALDDIAVRACGPLLTAAITPGSSVTAGTSVTFDGTISAGYTSPEYQWQSSTDGVTWTNIAGATSIDYTIPSTVTSDSKQYRLLSAESGNINNSNCRIVSNVVGLTVSAPLSIKENSLKAYYISESTVQLLWNFDGKGGCQFDLYGSYDGIEFVLLNTINCQNTGLYFYSHDFETYATSMLYFKVREYNGSETIGWSNVAYANSNISDNVVLFPNPVTPNSVLSIRSENTLSKIEIHDTSGKILYALQANDKSIMDVNVGELPKGLYFIKIETINGFSFKKIIVE